LKKGLFMTETSQNDPFRELSARHGYHKSNLLPIILKRIVTPEQAKILLQLPAEDAAALADSLGMEEGVVEKHLREMFEKGVTFKTRKGWRIARMIDSLHDMTLSNPKYHDFYGGPEYYALWNAFGKLEWWPDFVRHIRARGDPFMRVIPAVASVMDHPELLPEEDLRQLYTATSAIALIPCSCRMEMPERTCGPPHEMCIAVNRSAEYHLERGVGKRLSPEEAVEFDKTVRKHNAVAVAPMGKNLNMVVCNCHDCCCVGFRSFNECGTDLRELHAPSRYLAVVDHEGCIGCQKCLEICNYGAVELRTYPGMKKWKANIKAEFCMGCGNCVLKCPKDVISMKVVRPPDYILGSEENVDIYAYDSGKQG